MEAFRRKVGVSQPRISDLEPSGTRRFSQAVPATACPMKNRSLCWHWDTLPHLGRLTQHHLIPMLGYLISKALRSRRVPRHADVNLPRQHPSEPRQQSKTTSLWERMHSTFAQENNTRGIMLLR